MNMCILIVHLIYYAVISCNSVPLIANATIITANTSMTYNTTIVYQCLPGYWFQSRVYLYKSICQLNKTWSFVPPCIG